jgi:hypothetical protein
MMFESVGCAAIPEARPETGAVPSAPGPIAVQLAVFNGMDVERNVRRSSDSRTNALTDALSNRNPARTRGRRDILPPFDVNGVLAC